MALVTTSTFPKEVWEHILSYGAVSYEHPFEFIDLWQLARQTSRLLRVSVAQVFLDDFVRKPERCRIYSVNPSAVYPIGLKLVFDRMDEESEVRHNRRTRVIFKECKETKMIPACWDEKRRSAHKRFKYQKWKDAIETYLGTDDCGDEVSVHYRATRQWPTYQC